MSILVVGNPINLEGQQFGKIIDSFDIVIRINSFFGEERDTGLKTDIWAYYHPNYQNKQFYGLRPLGYYAKMKLMNGREVIYKDETYMTTVHEVIDYGETYNPTSGVLLLSVIIQLYSPVFIIGFFNTYRKICTPDFHYKGHHNGHLDKAYIAYLVASRKVIQID